MIYFDNSATTKPSDASLEKMREALLVSFGNPGSVHGAGMDARRLLDEARKEVGKTFGIRRPTDGDVIFTSGGSEANNLAIFGSLRAKERHGGKVFITDGEHASVENTAQSLEKEGFQVLRIPTLGGSLDLDFIEKNADTNTVLAAMMLVNNETGALYDIGAASRIFREKCPKIFIHCDAVQGYLKVNTAPKALGADSVAVSAHKIHAPKGAGALYVTADVIKAKKLSPIIFGGGQEMGLRSGTENVPAIAAFGAAAREGFEALRERAETVKELQEYLYEKIGSLVRINRPSRGIANITNITLPGIKSETLLNFMSQNGVCISAGSACSARAKKTSTALTAFGMPESEADTSVRISLSYLNTKEEIDTFAALLSQAVGSLARIR